jgi:hypothetical protein
MAAPADYAPYIRSALASLKTGLQARIDVYNAEAANLFDLEAPTDEDYFFGGDDLYVRFPKVEVAVPEGALGQFSLSRAEGEQGLAIAVSVWLEGETGEIPEMHERVLGYGRVATEVLIQPGAFGPAVEVSEVRSLYPMIPAGTFNPDTRQFDKWRTLAALEFQLNDIARRPL